MSGVEQFESVFGDVTVSQLIIAAGALVFLWKSFCELKKYLDKRYASKQERDEREKERSEQLREALNAINEYPKYREQSRKIQEKLNKDIESINKRLDKLDARMEATEGLQKKEKLSELKNEIVNAYRYYTDSVKNPSKSLTRIEYDAFFGLVESYEARGGDGYVHTEIIPAMERLTVIEMENVPPRQFVSSYVPASSESR